MHIVKTTTCLNNKKSIDKALSEIKSEVEYETQLEGGCYIPVKFIKGKVFDTEQEAMDYIESIDSHNYDQLAVRFRKPPEYCEQKINGTASVVKLKERIKTANEACNKAQANHFTDFKAAYVSCPSCGSKIAINYINGNIKRSLWRENICPVCRKDMRPQSLQEKEEKLRTKLSDLQEQLESEKERLRKKLSSSQEEGMWLIKYEYHI